MAAANTQGLDPLTGLPKKAVTTPTPNAPSTSGNGIWGVTAGNVANIWPQATGGQQTGAFTNQDQPPSADPWYDNAHSAVMVWRDGQSMSQDGAHEYDKTHPNASTQGPPGSGGIPLPNQPPDIPGYGSQKSIYGAPTPGVGGAPSTDLRSQIEQTLRATGQDTGDSSIAYWLNKKNELDARGTEIGNPNYFMQRLQGMGAGGADVVKAGPFAGVNSGPLQSVGGGGGVLGSGAYMRGQGVPGQGTLFGVNSVGSNEGSGLFKLLMDRATGAAAEKSNPNLTIDPNDPIIKNQTDAYTAKQNQARRSYLSQTAEQAGPTGNIGAEARSSAEKVGQNSGAFEAELMQQELGARRAEIQQALSGASGLLTAEQAMQLQEELSQLQLAQNAFQFDTQQQYLNSPLGPGASA